MRTAPLPRLAAAPPRPCADRVRCRERWRRATEAAGQRYPYRIPHQAHRVPLHASAGRSAPADTKAGTGRSVRRRLRRSRLWCGPGTAATRSTPPRLACRKNGTCRSGAEPAALIRCPAVVHASELDLPDFDTTDTTLHGEQFHAVMAALASRSWLARTPLGYATLDRESGEYFLRSRDAT